MTITQKEAVKAYKVLIGIQDRREVTTVKTAKKLFDLKRALQPAYEFQIEREGEAIRRYGAEVDEDGLLSFPKTEEGRQNAMALANEFNEIGKLDTEINIEPIVISDEANLHVNMDEIEALERFVTFE